MAGIAGIAKPDQSALVKRMLDKISHRGPAGRYVLEDKSGTLGVVWPDSQPEAGLCLERSRIAIDEVDNGHFAMATAEGFILKGDPVGAAPPVFWLHRRWIALFCVGGEGSPGGDLRCERIASRLHL